MAKGKMWYIGERPYGKAKHAGLYDSLEYIADEEKTEGIWYGGVNCLGQWESAYKEMMRTKRKYGKTDKRQAYHMILSFKKEENDKEKAWQVIENVMEELFGERFEVFYTMHTNTNHLHAHAIINSVSFTDGRKFRYEKGDWKDKFQPVIDKYALLAGFEKLNLDADERQGEDARDSGKINWYKINKQDIDTAIGEAGSYEEFEIIMRKMGYCMDYGRSGAGFCLKIKKAGEGQLNYRRCTEKTLGYAYTQEGIKDRIAAKKETYPIYQARQIPKAEFFKFNIKHINRAFRRWDELSPIEQFELKRFYVFNKRGRANYSVNWQVVNVYRRQARESLYKRDLVFKYKIFSYEKFEGAEEKLKSILEDLQEKRKDLSRKESIYAKELKASAEIKRLRATGNDKEADMLMGKLERESGHSYSEIQALVEGVRLEKEQLKKEMRFYRKEYRNIRAMHTEYARANGLPLPEELQENVSQTRPKEYAGRGEEGEETSYNKNISFQELSERKRAYVKNAAQAFNKLTARDYSRDAYYYCCDRKNPCNYIRMKSDTARDLNGEEYTKTEYCLYCDNKEVKNPDRPDGAFTDERVPGWNSGKWMELRDRMVELAGLSPDDLIMFYTEKGFQKYRQTYERDMERENRKQAKKR